MELKKLMTAVTVQAALMDELLALLERETAEMGDVNVAAMAKTNQAKEELLGKIAECAPVMEQAISDMAVREGFSSGTSFGVIAEHLSKKGFKEMQTKQQQLIRTGDSIQQVAAMNREIAERFAATIATSLNLITRLVNQSNVYGSSGGYQQRPTGAVMINREA
jgi:hypothetical protein